MTTVCAELKLLDLCKVSVKKRQQRLYHQDIQKQFFLRSKIVMKTCRRFVNINSQTQKNNTDIETSTDFILGSDVSSSGTSSKSGSVAEPYMDSCIDS